MSDKATVFDAEQISACRLETPRLCEAISAGLGYLADKHVFSHKHYKLSCQDFLTVYDVHGLTRKLIARTRLILGRHLVREKHLQGAWPGFIYYVPNTTKTILRPLFVVTDYNLFTTASTAYPLLLFDDRMMPQGMQVISEMLGNADKLISEHQRGSAYNFWKPHEHKKTGCTISGPLNIPVWLVGLRYKIYKLSGLLGLKRFHESDVLLDWISECFDKKKNPSGGPAIFNIPNDADNTSTAVSFKALYRKHAAIQVDSGISAPLAMLPVFRDMSRTKKDRCNKWIEKETGAFLTWLKDENQPVFENPDLGILPLKVNNLDLSIQANALFAMSLAGMQELSGFQDSLNFVTDSIAGQKWKEGNLYYPEPLVFAYNISRAWADGGLRTQQMAIAMQDLLTQLLNDQLQVECNNACLPIYLQKPKNAFSQALFVLALINIGQKTAEICGRANEYRQSIRKGIETLLSCSLTGKPTNKHFRDVFGNIQISFWKSGVLYSSSMKELALWRSDAQTTSLVVEALSKYLLAYDVSETSQLNRKLNLHIENQKLKIGLPTENAL